MDTPAFRNRFHVDVSVHRLGPGGRLALPRDEHTLVVRNGLLYVSLRSGDVALIPGDEIVVRPDDFRGAWCEGNGESEVVALRGG